MQTFRTILYWVFERKAAHDDSRSATSNKSSAHKEYHEDVPKRVFRWRHLLWNLFFMLLSAALIGTIAIVLRIYEDRPVLEETGITLNSVVSWLATLAKVAFTVPLAESIGQMKWVLFTRQEKRKLSDMDLVDGAGRDVFGALSWIFRFRGGFLVHFGAALIIASLGFEPAIQQMIVYEQVPVVNANLTANVAQNDNYVPVRGFDQGLILATPRALLWGAYSSVLGQEIPIEYSCPSGNCTFPDTTSVGICHTCEEITSQLTKNCTTLSKSKPFVQGSYTFSENEICTYEYNNATVGGGDVYLNLDASAVASIANASGDGNVAIPAERVNFTALFIAPGGEETDIPDGYTAATFVQAMSLVPGYVVNTDRARGFQCGISYCEKTFRNSVVNGTLTNTLLNSTSRDQFIIKIPTLSEITDALLSEPLAITDANKTRVSTAALFALSNGFSISLTGNATVVTGTPEPGQVSEFHRAIYEDLANSTFDAVMANMTDSMSSAIRNDAAQDLWQSGDVYILRIHVRVRWWWIVWPAAMWICTFVMLLAVCSGTRKSAVGWLANSQLAAMFYGLDENMRNDVDGQMGLAWGGDRGDAGEVREVAEKAKVRLGPNYSVLENGKFRFGKVRP
ncbi:hypothetical protein RUND412_005441 [Rhizina undulata]